ncbi:FAD-dependent oxidoreductase [Halorientalis brevis]|uniref:Glycerol-3-phosphate dehydrogenase n=1 Tax=Halorientalis brevis TaxID=1126241 RepID=A0ABD6CBZ3_9EURY|nr:FAD-dependent oxidoreductase [Halorientalis brevis]
MRQTDVLVVGGGATGAGVARDLALRGLDVTLVERGGLSAGTTGRTHGLLHSGARYAESDRAGAVECIEETRILKQIAGACVRDTGGFFVQLAEDDPAYFAEKRAACEDLGIPTEVVDSAAAREDVPGLAEAAERVLRVPDGVIYPSRLVAANAEDARRHGATILTGAPVQRIDIEGGQITGVAVGGNVDETVAPEYVVNAAGAWAGSVARMAGLTVEMRPTKGLMIAVEYEGLGPVLNRCRPPADGDIIVPHESEVVLGTTSVPVDDPDDFRRDEWEIETVFDECAKLLPGVTDADPRRSWWGVRPLYEPAEADREGRGISRGYVCLDHATDGVENAASIVGGKLTTYRAMAEVTADLVCDRLAVDAECRTADERLPAADDPARLDEFVATFDGQGPADEDVGAERP